MNWLILIAVLALLIALPVLRRWIAPPSRPTTGPQVLGDAEAWQVQGIKAAQEFFLQVPSLLPDATVLYLEGSPTPDVVQFLRSHAEQTDYGGPIGTIWSWPPNERYSLRATPELFAGIADLATRHAVPELCSHLHFYRQEEPLANWFDAFDDPFLISRTIPRERVDQFCTALAATVSEASA
ncbi:MAG TPA: hypothetical protein VHR41_05540 [Gemmatimonadales bacterium]|jgi:hypothetical protein|nr:hypothetical protein [Gemmatimonadales bacterium]